MKIIFSFWLLVFVVSGSGAYASVVDIAKSGSNLNITSEIEIAKAPLSVLDPTNLLFSKDPHGQITRSYSKENVWLKISFVNSGEESLHRLLYFDAPLMGQLTALEESDAGDVQEISGPGFPLEERAVPVRWAAFDVLLEPGQEKTYFIRRESHHAFNTLAFVADPEVFETNEAEAKSIFYFYLGGICCLILYNLVLGISTRQSDYILYSFFAGSFALAAMCLHNVIDTYLFPNSYIVFSQYLMFFSSMALFASTFFVKSFLNIRRDFAVGYWGCYIFRGLSLVPMCASLFVPHFRDLYFMGYWIDISIASALMFFIFCGFYSVFRSGFVLGYYFLLSWFAVMLGVMVWMASVHGMIRTSPLTQYSLILANLGEMLILSLGLAYKLKTLDQEKQAALQAAADKDRYHRLVKVLSHDVANAVSGVVYHTESLDSIVEDPQSREHLGRIGHLTEKLGEILNTVRAEEVFSAIKSNNLNERVDLRSACLEAIEHFSWELRDKNIHVDLKVGEGVYVRANRSALVNQVLVNLLSNCIKFSNPGSKIVLRTEDHRSFVQLLVCDEGIGIPKDKLEGLFHSPQIFSRSGTENETGTGMGSKLIGEYMKLFEGRVEVESVIRSSETERSGTTVRLLFPKKI